jgi:hypothetical protein
MAFLAGRRVTIQEIGADIQHLLEETRRSDSQEMCELDQVRKLDQLWSQQVHTANQPIDNKPITLNWKDCDACPYRMARRR